VEYKARKAWGVGQEEWDRLPYYIQERALIALDAEGYAEEQALKRAHQQ
jgi:hypothetical protein